MNDVDLLPSVATVVADLPGPNTRSKLDAIQVAQSNGRLAAMLAIAAGTQWPRAYHNDLYRHDVDLLATIDGPLVWILRNMGTHLYPLACANRGELRWAQQVIDYHSGSHRLNWIDDPSERPRIYVVDYQDAVQVTAEEAKSRLYIVGEKP